MPSSVDLIWGFCGILSLGHGAFFALGGYAMGMYLMRQIGSRGVYGHPVLPDFMVFLNWQELPWFWHGFDQFWFAALMVLVVPGLLAFVFGWFAFRSRVTGVYLSIITQALTFALMLAFFRNDMGFGGNNGLTDFKDHPRLPRAGAIDARGALRPVSARARRRLSPLPLHRHLEARQGAGRDPRRRKPHALSRLPGRALQARRLHALGGARRRRRRALRAAGRHHQSRASSRPANSIEVVIWVAVGGRGTLAGAALGALVVNAGKTWFTGAIPELWLFALGGLFVFVTLFLPKGILGTFLDLARAGAGAPHAGGDPSPTARLWPPRRSEP